MKTAKTFGIAAVLCALLCAGALAGMSAAPVANALTIGTEWTVCETATDLAVGDVSEGGVGKISYKTVPTGITGPAGEPYGNHVRIPVRGADVTDGYMSIKYRADYDVSGKHIGLFCGMTADVSENGGEAPAEDVLVGWFENWNVEAGVAPDGENYITVNYGEYTKTRTVGSVVLNFDYDGAGEDAGKLKTLELLGLDFHAKGEKPVFATDPKETAFDAPQADGCTTKALPDGALEVTLDGGGTLTYAVRNWGEVPSDRIVVDMTGAAGVTVAASLDGAGSAPIELYAMRRNVEFAADVETLSSFALRFEGTGSVVVHAVYASTAPHVTIFTTTNTEYFDAIEQLDDASYQCRIERNGKAGFPVLHATVSNWRPEYSILHVSFDVTEGTALVGIYLDATSIYSHWIAANFRPSGESELTFDDIETLAPTWSGTEIRLYVCPNSVSRDDYTYDATFRIGISFEQGKVLPVPTIATEQERYEYPYDGESHAVTATVDPPDLKMTTTYIDAHGTESADPPVAAGEYTVRFSVAQTDEYAAATKEVTLVITALPQEAPAASEWSYDYVARTIVLPAGLEASYDEAFATLIGADEQLRAAAPIYVRRKATEGATASPPVRATTPAKAAAVGEIAVVQRRGTRLQVDAGEGAEYRLVTDGVPKDWTDSGNFLGLTAGKEYVIEVRIAAGNGLFAGDAKALTLWTLNADGTDPTEPPAEEPKPVSGKKKGCGGMLAGGGAWLLSAAACALAEKRRGK